MAAVLSTWDTIWRSWKPAVDAWEQHKTAIASTRNDAEELGTVMVRAQKTIGNKYNEIVDPVGKGFAQGDGMKQNPLDTVATNMSLIREVQANH